MQHMRRHPEPRASTENPADNIAKLVLYVGIQFLLRLTSL